MSRPTAGLCRLLSYASSLVSSPDFPSPVASGPAVDLDGAVVLITGAAGALGAETTRRLAMRGARLAMADRDAAGLERLVAELAASKATAVPYAFDALNDDELLALPARVEADLGPVDVFVSSAGVEYNAGLHTTSVAEIDLQLGLHLRGPMLLTAALIPGMRERGRGHIVIISSLSGKLYLPAKSVYAAAKSGSLAFTHALRRELRGTGVTASVVAPSVVTGAGQAHRAMEGTDVDPAKLSGVTVAQCADAVLDALDDQRSEVMVTSGITAIVTGAQTVYPPLADLIVRIGNFDRFGIAAAEKDGRW